MAMLAMPAVGAIAQPLGKSSAQPQCWTQLHTQALMVIVVVIVWVMMVL